MDIEYNSASNHQDDEEFEIVDTSKYYSKLRCLTNSRTMLLRSCDLYVTRNCHQFRI